MFDLPVAFAPINAARFLSEVKATSTPSGPIERKFLIVSLENLKGHDPLSIVTFYSSS
jgi:hypothetical protein